jgi:Kef-type K+ transport system membrane component KefB
VKYTTVALWILPSFTGWYFALVGSRVSEPEIKFVLLILILLGGLATLARSKAVLPAYLIGLVLARQFLGNRVLMHRMRAIAFSILTPFYFIKAGSFVSLKLLVAGRAGGCGLAEKTSPSSRAPILQSRSCPIQACRE